MLTYSKTEVIYASTTCIFKHIFNTDESAKFLSSKEDTHKRLNEIQRQELHYRERFHRAHKKKKKTGKILLLNLGASHIGTSSLWKQSTSSWFSYWLLWVIIFKKCKELVSGWIQESRLWITRNCKEKATARR